MPNRHKEETITNGHGKGKIKFRYMDSERALDFSVENMTGDSVTEGLRSIANALAGRTIAAPSGRNSKPLAAAPTIDVEEEVQNPGEEIPEQEVLEAEQEETGEDEIPKPKRVIKPKSPKLLNTPNLTEAEVSLADFLKEKNATDMIDKYAVIAVWYKEQFQITDMNIDRIFTAFKHLGQDSKLPTDVEKPLKNLTYTKKWFDKAKGAGNYSINWVGGSAVGKMGAGAANA